MAQQVQEKTRSDFHGVYHAGNPSTRPVFTAQVCENFRIMPGYWLRLRSGRKARYYVGGTIKQLFSFRQVDFPGSDANIAQVVNTSNEVRWHWFSSLDFAIDPFGGILTINQANDGGYTRTFPAGVCNIEDRPILYNGHGTRDGSFSRPALSSYYGGVLRYFGLDAYCPGARPTVNFTAGAGLNAIVTDRIKIYVGLYNSATNHYSNVVYAGAIAPNVATGTITVGSLGNLTAAYNNGTELSELKYVFYATIEGGQIPYLILNSAMNGPHTAAIGSGSTSLSIASGTDNGWVLDLTNEAPTENYPPRRMKRISYVNQRMYGSLMSSYGSGFGVVADTIERPFDYSASARDTAGITWSKAAGETRNRALLGDPIQCWPLVNFIATPSAEAPIYHGPSPDESSLLVITGRSTYFLTEAVDGIHSWFTISQTSGIINESTVCVTPIGICWVNQKNQIVMLEKGAAALRILSLEFQSLMAGTPTCANYIQDPDNFIDRYQVWFSNGKSVIYDFVTEEAYTETGLVITAAGTITDSQGRRHHVIANSGFYTHEGQAETGLIPTADETFTGTGQAFTSANFTARWRSNWNTWGTITGRKSLPHMDVLVDSAAGAAFAFKWWKDFIETSDVNQGVSKITKADQSTTDSVKRVGLADHHFIAIKFEFRLTSHYADRATYAPLSDEGDLAGNFYGSILGAAETLAPLVNMR